MFLKPAKILHLFEQPGLLACLGAVVEIMAQLILVAAIRRTPPRYDFNQGARGHILGASAVTASLPIQIAVFAAWQPSSDAVILKFDTSPLFTDALSLPLVTMSIFLAANEWMGIIVPVRDMAVELNLQFFCDRIVAIDWRGEFEPLPFCPPCTQMWNNSTMVPGQWPKLLLRRPTANYVP
ncbi:hypothetical protein GGX14DRAFT_401210 [Mycena pura]|uniref:Uncharacterized protein n=1 Tax=Mycena pura TaxID=153505 RepID=A0AAD6V3A7_9AGAR|nr:hypothetical protein GGX14DRAFT_401210 [Mycena pura]